MNGNTKPRRKVARVQLDACARAFVFILWIKNDGAKWRAAVTAWRESSDPIGTHLAGYPTKHLHNRGVKLDHVRHALTAAAAASSARRLDEVLRPLCVLHLRSKEAMRPVGDVLGAVKGVDLAHVRTSRKLAEQVAERWDRSPPAPHESEVAAFVEAYDGPLGKVEAAAEQFSLPLAHVAQHLSGTLSPSEMFAMGPKPKPAISNPPSSPEPATLNFGALHAAQHEAARLREENRRLRALLVHYLQGDDHGA